MMFSLSHRTKLHMNLTLAALAIVGCATLSAPASAAKQSAVIAACKHTEGCWTKTHGGHTYGCTYLTCFSCTKGQCKKFIGRRSGTGLGHSVGDVSSRGIKLTPGKQAIQHSEAAPIKLRAPISNHVRTGGRH
jgi:hypothetical protein